MFSSWIKVLPGVLQEPIWGPILFNIFLNNLLFSVKEAEIFNFADDTKVYKCVKSIQEPLQSLHIKVV